MVLKKVRKSSVKINSKWVLYYYRHTIKPGPTEQWNTGKTIRIPQNSGTWEEQWNNGTTK